MTSWGHLAAGAIALALAQPLLKALQSNGSGASQLAKLANVPATLVSKFMDPKVPAFSAPLPTVPSSSSSSKPVTPPPSDLGAVGAAGLGGVAGIAAQALGSSNRVERAAGSGLFGVAGVGADAVGTALGL